MPHPPTTEHALGVRPLIEAPVQGAVMQSAAIPKDEHDPNDPFGLDEFLPSTGAATGAAVGAVAVAVAAASTAAAEVTLVAASGAEATDPDVMSDVAPDAASQTSSPMLEGAQQCQLGDRMTEQQSA